MAIIVTHATQGGRFVVLGADFARWKSARANRFFGDLFPVVEDGMARVLAVAGADGKIQFGNADDFRVLEVDGTTPAKLLAQGAAETTGA